jgi:dsRNA-specific ribonuclease
MPGAQLYSQANAGLRRQSTAAQIQEFPTNSLRDLEDHTEPQLSEPPSRRPHWKLSSKVFALHARLSLPTKVPVQTVARTLLDASAEPHPKFNNASLAVLGQDLLSYYTTEHLICTYPRLPMGVLYAAMYAYISPKTLAVIAREWGVELAAVPGSEVDPGLLQFKRVDPGSEVVQDRANTTRPKDGQKWRKTLSSSVVYDDVFGNPDIKAIHPKHVEATLPDPESIPGVTAEKAASTFVHALMGAIYLHAGRPMAKQFFQEHILSRHLDISKSFYFARPIRDLVKLCGRENFEAPTARIESETGRHSRHPVFVVGVYSGKDKLGEGTGSNIVEARTRAAISALKSWYLYSPLDVKVPSSTEEAGSGLWKPVHVDLGEICF